MPHCCRDTVGSACKRFTHRFDIKEVDEEAEENELQMDEIGVLTPVEVVAGIRCAEVDEALEVDLEIVDELVL